MTAASVATAGGGVPRGTRFPHEGPRDLGVFINCPYDPDYRPVFQAILLTLLCYGMWPRWADDTSRSSLRLNRIVTAMRGSRYSVHDLSRCKGEGSGNLARMNMPLELGMALEQAYPDHDPRRDHRCLVLVPDGIASGPFISDLDGFDHRRYDGGADAVVRQVAAFLKVAGGRVDAPATQAIQRALPLWDDQLTQQRLANGGEEPTWAEIVALWHGLASRTPRGDGSPGAAATTARPD